MCSTLKGCKLLTLSQSTCCNSLNFKDKLSACSLITWECFFWEICWHSLPVNSVLWPFRNLIRIGHLSCGHLKIHVLQFYAAHQTTVPVEPYQQMTTPPGSCYAHIVQGSSTWRYNLGFLSPLQKNLQNKRHQTKPCMTKLVADYCVWANKICYWAALLNWDTAWQGCSHTISLYEMDYTVSFPSANFIRPTSCSSYEK